MAQFREPIRGRGTNQTLPNRFETARFEPDPASGFADDETPDPRTRFIADASRSALSRNQSPDVGFEVGINPYRGCEHGCIYCLAPDTPVLYADLAWRPLGEVKRGDVLAGFDEVPRPGSRWKLRPSSVLAVWSARKPGVRLVTEHAEVVTTAEHRWLRARGFRWSRTDQLEVGATLRHLPVVIAEPIDDDYRAGYVAGLSLGRGHRFDPRKAYYRIALPDRETRARLVACLAGFGVSVSVLPASTLEVRSLASLAILFKLIDVERSSRGYRRGFLAGHLDASGRGEASARAHGYARSLGFDPGRVGSGAERLRFVSTVAPAAARHRESLFGHVPPTSPERIHAIVREGDLDVVDIQTSTGTFFAAGLATHNCYARPTHEYLGYSAGLDFETRILVKHELPELLRGALSAKSWKPQPIGISGVTDAYQPIERKLRITRRSLEVLADFRNPCAIITKSRLIVRDGDVLQELARHDAVSVTISLTTLDPELARRMEPRAAQPRARLWAIEQLARAGIPVGVNLAPIVPGLTEHEIPALVAAAGASGAAWAGWQLLRLPWAVKDLFAQWLEDHEPDRREKILHRLADLRGGKSNESRFGLRHRGTGIWAGQIAELVALARRRSGMEASGPTLNTAAFRRPETDQLALF